MYSSVYLQSFITYCADLNTHKHIFVDDTHTGVQRAGKKGRKVLINYTEGGWGGGGGMTRSNNKFCAIIVAVRFFFSLHLQPHPVDNGDALRHKKKKEKRNVVAAASTLVNLRKSWCKDYLHTGGHELKKTKNPNLFNNLATSLVVSNVQWTFKYLVETNCIKSIFCNLLHGPGCLFTDLGKYKRSQPFLSLLLRYSCQGHTSAGHI